MDNEEICEDCEEILEDCICESGLPYEELAEIESKLGGMG